MNSFIFFINRIYYVLVKRTKNESPFFGAIILAAIFIVLNLNSLILLVFSFTTQAYKINYFLYFASMIIIFLGTHQYANQRREQVTDLTTIYPLRKNLLVITVCMITIVTYIVLSTINREKIFSLAKDKPQLERKKSLEGRIRGWFE